MSFPARSLLLIDPDPASGRVLGGCGLPLEVEQVSDLLLARARLAGGQHEVVVAELGRSGDPAELFRRVAEVASELPVVVSVCAEDAERAVLAVRAGARDYLRKPFDPDEANYVLGKVLSAAEPEAPEPTLSPRTEMIGQSPAMQELRARLARAAAGTATVLIRGESGTGKEVVARQLHELGPRRDGPLVKVHCAALPENLLESELFGYEKGAFTGATQRKPGRVELAQGGTLFLDEIGDISPVTQVKLLRVVQDREYERLGGTETLRADVRLVTATHRDLEKMVEEGTFRQDLFYRLNVVTLWVPPLRERRTDIEQLAVHFCSLRGQSALGRRVALGADALGLLARQPWPGNVRQLENFIERLVVMTDSPRLSAADVEAELGRVGAGRGAGTSLAVPLEPADLEGLPGLPAQTAESAVVELEEAVRKAEKRALEKALRKAGGNRNLAARLLGISRRTLYYKLEEHGLR
jgi:two-component system, NtrC family, response regulator AtoC